ncbi:vancomycin permeability regulator SanA [Murinocardiopsis flavida]|uniref:Vancomycin permeability regulator SanA n=1 Tax=Murinocardiopsis flavida TaxID=645275 RepID=A0A2P8D542_9ACTN|nr:ElyC/SanA/YdcF family protein [Murinocardiopsis flavida]PSK92328.1 vancomycin permeability regulator SanA [Murinocardiopsis flavida]
MGWGVWAAAAACAGSAALAVPTAWTYAASARHRYTPGAVPARRVALVLGAAAWASGPSPMLARRLDLGARLLAEGRVGAILVSGDNRAVSGHETDTMAEYLVGNGVPKEHIAADPAGLRTWDSCVRARDVYGVRSVVVVTQAFHLPRAVAVARAAGLDAVGVGDPSLRRRSRATMYGYAREVVANAKALGDVVLRSAPAQDGPSDPEAVRRLAAARPPNP